MNYKNVDDLFLDGEIWKDIEGYGGDYQVSNFGRIKSFKKYKKGKILKQSKNDTGYLQINLYKNGKGKSKRIHRLILETFNPISDIDNFECNHINGIKTDNRLENLEWSTRSENVKHMFKLGLKSHKKENHPLFGKHRSEKSKIKISKTRKERFLNGQLVISKKTREKMRNKKLGENNNNSKLEEWKVKSIYQISNSLIIKQLKITQQDIADVFSVKKLTINRIKNRRIWTHLKMEDL